MLHEQPKPPAHIVGKVPWIQKAIDTYKYHASRVQANKKHRVKDTATELKRSVGSISEDLLIASWLKTHRAKIESLNSTKEALEFIRSRKHTLLSTEHFEFD